MSGHTFFGKQRICYTNITDFTDYQGIGHDPLYRRFDSVFSVVKQVVAPEYQHFLATPQYLATEDQISWHIDEWTELPVKLTDLADSQRSHYEAIKTATIQHYRQAAMRLEGEALSIYGSAIKDIEDDCIYCADNKVYLVAWGMTKDTRRHTTVGSILHEYEENQRIRLTFSAGDHGIFDHKYAQELLLPKGSTLSADLIPVPQVDEGWEFNGWQPTAEGHVIEQETTFTATYHPIVIPTAPIIEEPVEPDFYTCHFDAGTQGLLLGDSTIELPTGSTLSAEHIPAIKPFKHQQFTGWSPTAEGTYMDEDKYFTAQYTEILPWYKRLWLWLTGRMGGCLRWLLWLLLLLLGLALAYFFLRSCTSCIGPRTENGVAPIDNITLPDGSTGDDNGYAHPITDADGTLPESDGIAAPVMGEGGTEPPIEERPGMPSVIANRLFLFMEDDNGNLDALAQDFKKAYPDEKYSIIGFDRDVKLLVIQIPEAERDAIRSSINGKLSAHKFLVFDEEIYELKSTPTTASERQEAKGWHLGAIGLKEGWNYTRGSSNVKVAIVDDGIQATHPMFAGRIVEAYNVFTQNNRLSVGDGHGTHVAGLAAGSDKFYAEGASGVAPGCNIMPVQVFDNRRCPLSALVAGIMYAVHHDADVINVSSGPSLAAIHALPPSEQLRIGQTEFKNTALLWARVCSLAAKKRSIIVFAAGNDDILSIVAPENRNASSIVVTAVDSRRYPTQFTNYGHGSDISAPGLGINSAYPTNSFKMQDVTSMAAPIVTGAIALMKSIKKDLTTEQARNALWSTGLDVYGNIPPMVHLGKVLEATKRGDFKRIDRKQQDVPEADNGEFESWRITPGMGSIGEAPSTIGVAPEQGTTPSDGTTIVTDPGIQATPVAGNNGNGSANPPAPNKQPADGVDNSRGGSNGNTPTPPATTGNDYEAIRRLIQEYEQRIQELKKQLPKEKQKK